MYNAPLHWMESGEPRLETKNLIPLFPLLEKGRCEKSGLSVGQEYLKSFTNAVIWKAKVT